MDHIFFSPHADDAIACCGGTIAQLLATGKKVMIETLFCGEAVPPFSPAANELHKLWGNPKDVVRLRRAEDEAAAARLGILICFGETREATYRCDRHGNWLYSELDKIFGVRHPEDDGLVTKLIKEIRTRFSLSKTRLYFPLGIGFHVDHLIVFEVGQAFLLEGYDVVFYEDFPYAAKKSDYQQRLAALPGFKCVTIGLSERDMLAKIEAFSYYRSQIPMLFNNYPNMPVEFIEYAKAVGGSSNSFGERLWFDARVCNPFQ
jgi:LmbE family N-acetylglucosaminyl deacetylase